MTVEGLAPDRFNRGLAGKIDFTLLRPEAAKKEIEDFLNKALKYPFASVCIPPVYAGLAADVLRGSGIKTTTVVGFPLGFCSASTKLYESLEAASIGAEEIDLVINISALKSGELSYVEDELAAIVSALNGIPLKAILETCYLTDAEKKAGCEAAIRAGASFVKTSTGFAPLGATVEDVRLLSDTAAGRIKVKAAGGIKELATALKMLDAGATRLGTSRGIEILEELKKRV